MRMIVTRPLCMWPCDMHIHEAFECKVFILCKNEFPEGRGAQCTSPQSFLIHNLLNYKLFNMKKIKKIKLLEKQNTVSTEGVNRVVKANQYLQNQLSMRSLPCPTYSSLILVDSGSSGGILVLAGNPANFRIYSSMSLVSVWSQSDFFTQIFRNIPEWIHTGSPQYSFWKVRNCKIRL